MSEPTLAPRFQVAYCDNDVDCRRTLQLAHFGENFDAGLCKGTCDNCARGATFVETDVTEAAQQLVGVRLDMEKGLRAAPLSLFHSRNRNCVRLVDWQSSFDACKLEIA